MYGGQGTDTVMHFSTMVGVELKFRMQIQKSERLSGFSLTENTK
jgi:hypothetical protein